jgi:hypothetical protein
VSLELKSNEKCHYNKSCKISITTCGIRRIVIRIKVIRTTVSRTKNARYNIIRSKNKRIIIRTEVTSI